MFKIITWNIHNANQESPVWKLLLELQPDLVLLQEVGSIPEEIKKVFDILSKRAIKKTGNPQNFSTAVLVRGKIIKEISLKSEYEWVNRELKFFEGSFISCIVQLQNEEPANVVSVHSPAWPVDKKRLKEINISPLKLQGNPKIWGTEIIWSALKNTISNNERWIVGGDYNISETFDIKWQNENKKRFSVRSHGSREIIDRMYNLGFKECLRKYNNKIIPTFKHPRGGIDHQIDHLFVTNDLYSRLISCTVGDQSVIFGESLSDHLPIIADFSDK